LYNHYLHYSTLFVCSSTRQQMWTHWWLSIHGMDLKLFLHRTITKSGNKPLVIIKLQQWLFLMCWQTATSLSHLYIKEWRPEVNNFTSAETLQKLFSCQISLRISKQLSYLRNSRVLTVCIWFVLWTPLIVYQVFNLKHFSL